jgi:hypothetical protein
MILQMLFTLMFVSIICYTLYKIFQLFSGYNNNKSTFHNDDIGYPNKYIRKGYKHR